MIAETTRHNDALEAGFADLIDTAVESLLRGHVAHTITERTARPALQVLATKTRQLAEHYYLSSLRTSDDAAATLGLSRARILALARSRGLGWRIGRDVLFRQQDIDAMRERRPGRPARAKSTTERLPNVNPKPLA